MVFVRETGASGTFVTAELALVVSRHDHQKLYECRSANWADDHIVEMIIFCPDNHDGKYDDCDVLYPGLGTRQLKWLWLQV